ncbi:hypothetical protein [Dokdonella sp.]|uniref:hypothetical protein n=1 Tax=Dokdonella sp. TaxID=2291710 RepID=UPI0025C03071|nr:hypothetical protein [Dokdonella sp.]MBX3691626.1 hypothetical protein [Dokdonella sp.]
MITDKTTARRVSELMLDVGAKLDESVALVQATSSEHEFNQYRRAIGEIMGAMLLKVMNPLYSANPELKPKELE